MKWLSILVFACFGFSLIGCKTASLDDKISVHNQHEIEARFTELKKKLQADDFEAFSEARLYIDSYFGMGMAESEKEWVHVRWLNDMTVRQVIVTGNIVHLQKIQSAMDGEEGKEGRTLLMLKGKRDAIRSVIAKYSKGQK